MELKGIELKDGMIIETENRKYWYFNNRVFYKSETEYIASYEAGYLVIKQSTSTKCGFMELDNIYAPIKLITYGDKVLYEKKEILDEKEKEYLSAVIKPFRDKVMFIGKYCCIEKEFVNIIMHDDVTSLPCFKKGTMYKGMQVENKYTLEELGL